MISERIKGVLNNLEHLFEVIIASYKTKKTYNIGIIKSIKRSYYLAREHHFRLEEAWSLGLYSPLVDKKEICKFISKRRLSREQARVNPANWFWVTESKDIFYQICNLTGIEIPKLYAVYYKNSSGITFEHAQLGGISEWSEFFNNKLPERFVIKPARGVYGKGLELITKKEGKFYDVEHEIYSAEIIIEKLNKNKLFDSWIIQERLVNHNDIDEICRSDYLQSLRIVSFIREDGLCEIQYALLKLVTGESIVDNFHGGSTGNLLVHVDVANGVLSNPIGPATDAPGFQPAKDHNRLEKEIDGSRLPLWKETCECVKYAAEKLRPIRSIGWDVAITPEGPRIVEANIRWDPLPNVYQDMGKILEKMK